MERKLALALALAKGHQIPDNAVTIEVGNEDASFYDEDGRWIRGASVDIDNTWLGGDSWSIELTGQYEVTIDEFKEWLEANPTAVAEYHDELQVAVQRMAELTPSLQDGLAEALSLSKRYGLPFTIDVEGEEVDLRKAHLVDWNSSSMYC